MVSDFVKCFYSAHNASMVRFVKVSNYIDSTEYKLFTVAIETSMAKISAPLQRVLCHPVYLTLLQSGRHLQVFLNFSGLFGSEGCEAWVLSFLKILEMS